VILLVLIRHMPTLWTEEGLLQGRIDVPALRNDLTTPWELPFGFLGFRYLTSPLERCKTTARRLGMEPMQVEPRLVEMDWGKWEGRRLAELRADLGAAMAAEEAKGLDFRPPGGESPRDVQQRVKPLLAEIAATDRDTVAITHKGVIRAIYALATGWDMLGKPPHKLSWSAAHLFTVERGGRPAVERLNILLEKQPK